MKHNSLAMFFSILFALAITSTTIAQTPQQYKKKLFDLNVILSATADEEMVAEWLLDTNSGYPDLANKLISILNNTRPKSQSTVLNGIMGKYKIVQGQSPSDYIAPPYDIESIRKAYVKNWRDRNSGEWNTLSDSIKTDYEQAFNYITNPIAHK